MRNIKLSVIFEDEPNSWGLRGDPYLWREMKQSLKDVKLPDSQQSLKELIEQTYETLTGFSITHEEHVHIERFAHGGMSSGMVSQHFWMKEAIPLLLSRYMSLYQGENFNESSTTG